MSQDDSSLAASQQPLSPSLVASLHLDLSWLDVRASTSTTTTASSEPGHAVAERRKSEGHVPDSPTLAVRRITTANTARPSLFRRRSKSLDDASAEEFERSGLSPRGIARSLRLDPAGASHPAEASASAPPLSAVSFDGSLNSLATSSAATATVCAPVDQNGGPHGSPRGRAQRPRVPSEQAQRLAHWVETASNVTRQQSAESLHVSERKLQREAPRSPNSRRIRAASPGLIPMPASPVIPQPHTSPYRGAHAPPLPSPLSTCSYTSADEPESPEDAAGFPFPVTPAGGSPKSGSNGEHSEERPNIETRKTDETVSSTATVHDPTPTSGENEARHSVAAALTDAFTSGRQDSSNSVSFDSMPRSPDSSPNPSGSSSFSLTGSAAYPRPPSVASTSSASLVQSAGAPLTPPDQASTSPYLYGSSGAEMAWHEVLGARYGAGQTATGGAHTVASKEAETGIAGLGDAQGHLSARRDSSSSDARRASREAPTSSSPAEHPAPGGPGAAGGERSWGGNELMGSAAGGGFAAATREKIAALLANHVPNVPFVPADDHVVHLVEYGALNSRSSVLVLPVLEDFARREYSELEDDATANGDRLEASRRSSSSSNPELDELVSFQVTHVDRPASDFRCLADWLEHDPNSYLRARETSTEGDERSVPLEGRVFSSFAARPFGRKAVPRKSVSVGWSAMALHWPATDLRYRVAPATLAHGEVLSFLSARASEFKPGGVLVMAYIGRTEEAALLAAAAASSPSVAVAISTPSSAGTASSPSSTTSPVLKGSVDMWSNLSRLLGKAIQRLVSTGLLKPQVARQLLSLPLHPRTPRQTAACLRASAHSWDVLESEMVTLSHPAWKGVEHGTVSIESWADHTIQILKVFWEDEMRSILRDVLGSRGSCEWVLDCLWTVAREKLEEQPPQPLDLDVQFVALRRREHSPSSPGDATGSQSVTPVA